MSDKKIIKKTSIDQCEASLEETESRLLHEYGKQYTIYRCDNAFTVDASGSSYRIKKYVGSKFIEMVCDPDSNIIVYRVCS